MQLPALTVCDLSPPKKQSVHMLQYKPTQNAHQKKGMDGTPE
jgi:hypothetical protein